MTRGRLILTLLSLLAAATPALAAEPPASPYAIVRPAEWGPVALVVVSLRRGYPVPGRYYCPPDLENGGYSSPDAQAVCISGTFIDHPGRAVRILASADFTTLAAERRFRRIGGHAVRWVDGGRLLAVVEQTASGYVWMPWSTPLRGRRACLPTALIERFHITFPAAPRRTGDGDQCIRL